MTNTKDWWLTTTDGARIGWLQLPTFIKIVAEMFPPYPPRDKAPMLQFAHWVGVGKSTVYRWADGTDPIPKWVALLVAAERAVWMCGDDHTIVDAPWLPYSEGANGNSRTLPLPPDGGTRRTEADDYADRVAAHQQKYITHR